MQLSNDTKRFFLALSAFTVALLLCVQHFTAIGAWLLGALSAFSPFIVGGCMAFVISVPMRLFDRLLAHRTRKGQPLVSPKSRRPLSLLLAIVLIVLLIALFVIIVMPQLLDTVSSLAGSVMHFVPTAQGWISDVLLWLEDYPEVHNAIAPLIPDLNQLAASLISLVQKYAGLAATTIVSNVSSLFGSVTDVIISFVFAIYMLLQTESLARQCKKMLYAFLPKAFCDSVVGISRLAHRTFFSYVTIQCTEAMILGALCFAGMVVLRFPHALVISVIMLFCALIPIYGAIISCVGRVPGADRKPDAGAGIRGVHPGAPADRDQPHLPARGLHLDQSALDVGAAGCHGGRRPVRRGRHDCRRAGHLHSVHTAGAVGARAAEPAQPVAG